MSLKPVTDYVYNSEEMLADPDAVFGHIGNTGSVVWVPLLKRWFVLSKLAALSALKNEVFQVVSPVAAYNRVSEVSGKSLDGLVRISAWIPFFHEGERHRQLRALFSKVVADIRDDYLAAIQCCSVRLLSEMLSKGGGDFAKEYGDRLHVEAIGALAGFTEEHLRWISLNSSVQGGVDFASNLGELLEANQRIEALLEHITQGVTDAPHLPFISALGRYLSAAGIADSPANRGEFVTALVLVGRDTLSGTLSVGLAYLLDSNNGLLVSDSWKGLNHMEDEIIRLSSAVQFTRCVATQPVKLDSIDIAVGEEVVIVLQAANRDPASFGCPHAHSADNGLSIAFGGGRHLCVGMSLSRSVVRTVMQDLGGIQFIGSLPGRRLGKGKIARKYESLPVEMKNLKYD